MSYLLPEWQRLLQHVPGPQDERGLTPTEIWSQCVWWRRSKGQLAHALRSMRDREDPPLLESPSRGCYRLTATGEEARGG